VKDQVKDMSAARVSVVICVFTRERWDDILAAIASVRGQSLPAHELIVVVDHNRELFDELGAELAAQGDAAVRISLVPNLGPRGLSGGKNTGVSIATGDVVAFLDDDAVAEPKWLKYLADSYTGDEVAGVGGLTLPNWDTERPRWFPAEFDWVIGCNYKGMPQPGQPVRNLLGGNASFRREVFDVVGGFASGVGRSAGRLPLGCEETEFCIRIGQRRPRAVLLIDDRAVIWHRIKDDRATPRYFLRRCYAEGLSKAAVSRRVGSADGLAAERRQAFAALPAGVLRNLAALVRGDLAGLGRAAAILAGLSVTVAGYVRGRLTGRLK
jgi:glycosyltransferase involved in cell wall biosynthesis